MCCAMRMHCGKFSAISLRPLPLSVSSFVGFCLHEQAVGLLVQLPAGVEHVFIIYVSLSALNKFFLFVLNHVLKEILKEKVLLCLDWPRSGSRTFWTGFGPEPDPRFGFGFMYLAGPDPQVGFGFSAEPEPEVRTRTSGVMVL